MSRIYIFKRFSNDSKETHTEYKKRPQTQEKAGKYSENIVISDTHVAEHFNLPMEQAANALMNAEGFADYVQAHGYHFTDALAEYVCSMMVNIDGTRHRWSVQEVKDAVLSLGFHVSDMVTDGDMAYLANMYYSDFYPDPLDDEVDCIRAAYRVATDPDGYDGIAFCRWTADTIGRAKDIDWPKFI